METRKNRLSSALLVMALGFVVLAFVAGRFAYMQFNDFISLGSKGEAANLLFGIVLFGVPASFLLSVSVSLFLAGIVARKRDR